MDTIKDNFSDPVAEHFAAIQRGDLPRTAIGTPFPNAPLLVVEDGASVSGPLTVDVQGHLTFAGAPDAVRRGYMDLGPSSLGERVTLAKPVLPMLAFYGEGGKVVWAFHPDGRVEIGDHVTSDEAGRNFIDYLMKQWPVAVAERQN